MILLVLKHCRKLNQSYYNLFELENVLISIIVYYLCNFASLIYLPDFYESDDDRFIPRGGDESEECVTWNILLHLLPWNSFTRTRVNSYRSFISYSYTDPTLKFIPISKRPINEQCQSMLRIWIRLNLPVSYELVLRFHYVLHVSIRI